MNQQYKKKNFRRRNCYDSEDGGDGESSVTTKSEEEEEEHRMALEEVKFLQKQRERRAGIPAVPPVSSQTTTTGAGGASSGGGLVRKSTDASSKIGGGGGNKNENAGGEGDKDDLVLQDTFAQETAVMVEDPNMLKYIEQELAKKRGRTVETEAAENDLKQAEDELYKIPEHLKVKRRNSNESSTQWTTGIAEVQLPIEYKLKNIEETEAAKKLLQEKRFVGRSKSEFSIPSSYSADYFHRGRDYAEKLRREHPELYKDRSLQDDGSGSKPTDTGGSEAAGQRQAATDEFMLERFRKRERHRVMRR
ncbi:protein COP1 SUPPRESSOR 2 [Benincasa hispida]|uniref:protein COP1 SUPPRESSOR 2 n=1 Tax=Benincasa hispida TaxID=102211 RepID=UPI001900CD43|nr:protein COP1 SUPPRESSOR 2 [Benincasa hispida]